MNIGDIMTERVISICEDEPVFAAARLMKQNNVGALPVRDEKGKLKGIVTDRDIVLRCVASNASLQDVRIGEIMSRNLVTASPFEDAEKAIERMGQSQIRRLPVTDNGVLVGIVALGDIARNVEFEMEAAEALSEISANFRRR
ncbi:MAG: CBS domain-containing protein [Clostridiales bacterium]|jgi:CBS domain-containing protein|nr:CBS domain-containing protein [Clostridiales bacterium]